LCLNLPQIAGVMSVSSGDNVNEHQIDIPDDAGTGCSTVIDVPPRAFSKCS
jgi:hypothetical protein